MTDKPHDRTDESLIALRRILRATELYARDLAQAVGVTPAQLRVMQIVDDKTSATPKTLANQMRVSQATITTLVDKLVDRRQINILMTDLGHNVLEKAPDALQQRYVRAFAGLADWEQAQLVSSLERVADMLDAQNIDASPVLATGELGLGKKL